MTISKIDPIKDFECDKGKISENKPSQIQLKLEKKLGDMLDVYCVAKNKKKLATLDFSNYGKNKLRKLDKTLINKVISYSNYKNVKALHNKKTGGYYLKTIFYTKKNYKNALKLMDILWNPTPIFYSIDFTIALGLLLGYSKKNITYIVERDLKNLGYGINKKKMKDVFKIIQDKIDNMDTTLEDLNKHSKIVILDEIPLL
jgi:uncharacterized protein YlaN (UPF0358 family)